MKFYDVEVLFTVQAESEADARAAIEFELACNVGGDWQVGAVGEIDR